MLRKRLRDDWDMLREDWLRLREDWIQSREDWKRFNEDWDRLLKDWNQVSDAWKTSLLEQKRNCVAQYYEERNQLMTQYCLLREYRTQLLQWIHEGRILATTTPNSKQRRSLRRTAIRRRALKSAIQRTSQWNEYVRDRLAYL